MALVNSFVAYNEFTNQTIPFLDYKTKVVDGLFQLSRDSNQGRPISSPLPAKVAKSNHRKFTASNELRYSNVGSHWPTKSIDKKGKAKNGRCEYCSVIHHQEKRSTWMCKHCNTFLCLEANRNCFYEFHIERNESN